jgi:hypothetical protein
MTIAEDRLMKNACIVLVAFSLLFSGEALAKDAKKKAGNDAFLGSELIVGRYVKQPKKAKRFELGFNFQFMPVATGLSYAKRLVVDAMSDAVCGSAQDPAQCEQDLDAAVTVMQSMDDEQWEQMKELLLGTGGQSAEELCLQQGGTAQDCQDAQNYQDSMNSIEQSTGGMGMVEDLLDWTRGVPDSNAYLFEPNLEVNLKVISLNLRVPFGVVSDFDDKRWYFGNMGLDAKFGWAWGKPKASFGLGAGVSLYIPTATEHANRMVAADLWAGPKFSYGYLSLSPFVSIGFYNKFISLQAHGEFVNQFEVKDTMGEDYVPYFKYGTGLVLLPALAVSIIAELNGLVPLNDAAERFDALFLLGGLQLQLWKLKASIAVQIPLLSQGENSFAKMADGDFDAIAKLSLICRAAIIF